MLPVYMFVCQWADESGSRYELGCYGWRWWHVPQWPRWRWQPWWRRHPDVWPVQQGASSRLLRCPPPRLRQSWPQIQREGRSFAILVKQRPKRPQINAVHRFAAFPHFIILFAVTYTVISVYLVTDRYQLHVASFFNKSSYLKQYFSAVETCRWTELLRQFFCCWLWRQYILFKTSCEVQLCCHPSHQPEILKRHWTIQQSKSEQ